MSHLLKFFKPLPPKANNEVNFLFRVWREKNFPEGITNGDYSYLDVPIPTKELLEIDDKYRLGDMYESAESCFKKMLEEYVQRYWRQTRRLRVGIILAGIVCACVCIYYNL